MKRKKEKKWEKLCLLVLEYILQCLKHQFLEEILYKYVIWEFCQDFWVVCTTTPSRLIINLEHSNQRPLYFPGGQSKIFNIYCLIVLRTFLMGFLSVENNPKLRKFTTIQCLFLYFAGGQSRNYILLHFLV